MRLRSAFSATVVALGIDDWRAQATFAVDAATATSQAPTRVELQPPR